MVVGPSFGRVGFPCSQKRGLEGACPPKPRLTLAPEGVISLPRRWTHATHPWQYPFHGIHTHGDQGCWALSQSAAFALGTFQPPATLQGGPSWVPKAAAKDNSANSNRHSIPETAKPLYATRPCVAVDEHNSSALGLGGVPGQASEPVSQPSRPLPASNQQLESTRQGRAPPVRPGTLSRCA